MQLKSHICYRLTIFDTNRFSISTSNPNTVKTKLIISVSLIIMSFTSYSQSAQTENEYNFWVGEWTAIWVKQDGTKIEGTNTIEKTLDGKVLQEHFYDPSTNFKGTSISVFNPTTKTWHQAWADNQGNYFNFIGETIGEKKIFKTLPVEKEGKVFLQRMVFYNITETSMTWDWESSFDGGEKWALNWRIAYTKK